MTKLETLNKYFGYSSFRPAQETLIDAQLSGRDVFRVMPTREGKKAIWGVYQNILQEKDKKSRESATKGVALTLLFWYNFCVKKTNTIKIMAQKSEMCN